MILSEIRKHNKYALTPFIYNIMNNITRLHDDQDLLWRRIIFLNSPKKSYVVRTQKNHLAEVLLIHFFFLCVEVLQPSQSNGVMTSGVSFTNHTFTGQA